VFVGLLFLASNAARDQSHMNRNVGHRFTQWQKGLVLLARSPVIGVGVGSFQQVDRHLETLVPYLLAVRTSGRSFSGRQLVEGDETGPGSPIYNSYLKVLLDFGLVGLALYAAWYWHAFQRGREVLRFSTALDPDLTILRQHATYNATVVGLSLVFIGMQSMTESQCLIGPSGHVLYAAAFGRLVAQSELLRSHNRPPLEAAATR
jgi:O-antigen ligase